MLNRTDDPTPPDEKKDTKAEVSDDDIMFALFDGDKGITEEMYEEVKNFARYMREKKAKEREDNGSV